MTDGAGRDQLDGPGGQLGGMRGRDKASQWNQEGPNTARDSSGRVEGERKADFHASNRVLRPVIHPPSRVQH